MDEGLYRHLSTVLWHALKHAEMVLDFSLQDHERGKSASELVASLKDCAEETFNAADYVRRTLQELNAIN